MSACEGGDGRRRVDAVTKAVGADETKFLAAKRHEPTRAEFRVEADPTITVQHLLRLVIGLDASMPTALGYP